MLPCEIAGFARIFLRIGGSGRDSLPQERRLGMRLQTGDVRVLPHKYFILKSSNLARSALSDLLLSKMTPPRENEPSLAAGLKEWRTVSFQAFPKPDGGQLPDPKPLVKELESVFSVRRECWRLALVRPLVEALLKGSDLVRSKYSSQRSVHAACRRVRRFLHCPVVIKTSFGDSIVCCPGLTYRQDTSSKMGAIQTRDRHVGGRCVWHFDEAEPAGAPGVPISSNAYPIHLSVNLEQRQQMGFEGIEGEISDEKFLQSRLASIRVSSVHGQRL